MKPILIALMILMVGSVKAQCPDGTKWRDGMATTSYMVESGCYSDSLWRVVYSKFLKSMCEETSIFFSAGDYVESESHTWNDSLGCVVKKTRWKIKNGEWIEVEEQPKSRAEKKIELQEASKRSADFEEILREAGGRHDCLAEMVKAWKEYKRECEPKDSTWEKYETFVAPNDVYVKFPGIPKLYLKKGEKLQYPIEIGYSTTIVGRTLTLEGFMEFLKRRKK